MTETPDTERSPNRGAREDSQSDGAADGPPTIGNPVAGQSGDAPLSLEDVFEILRNERRQHVLSYLLLTDEDRVELGDLAEHIAAIENDKPIDRLTSQERKRVYVALYQCHLPKMASVEVVEFDKDRGVVEPGRNIQQFDPYLDLPTGSDDDEQEVPVPYLVLAATGVVAYLLAAVLGTGGTLAGGVVVLAGAVAFLAMTYR